MRTNNLKRHEKICQGDKGMYMPIPSPRVLTPAKKSNDLRGMHITLPPRIVTKSTKNTKFKELVKMVNKSEGKEHPSTVAARNAIDK